MTANADSGLWRHRDFRLYWTGQASDVLGSSLNSVAIPLVAVVSLNATTWQAAILAAVQKTPPLLFSRPASAWCERVRKRPLMMTTSLACAAAMGSIPLAASFGRLTLMQLWVAAFAVGSCHVVGMAASLSYIPHLVPSHRLMEANAKLASANTLADIGGPALAGALIGVIGAARAVAADAVSYLVTAWCTLSIRSPETVLDQHTAKRSLRSEIQAGRPRLHLAPSRHRPARDHECDHLHRPRPHQRHLGRVPNPRTPLVTAGVRRGHEHRRERRIPGLLTTPRLTSRYGAGPVMITALALAPASQLPLLLAGPGIAGQLGIGCGLFAQLFGAVTHGLTQRTVRQRACAPDMQGHMQATGQWTAFGLRPFAALLAGYAGTTLGLRTTCPSGPACSSCRHCASPSPRSAPCACPPHDLNPPHRRLPARTARPPRQPLPVTQPAGTPPPAHPRGDVVEDRADVRPPCRRHPLSRTAARNSSTPAHPATHPLALFMSYGIRHKFREDDQRMLLLLPAWSGPAAG